MSVRDEWAREESHPHRHVTVKGRKTGTTHALSRRRKFGRERTICGRVVEIGWSRSLVRKGAPSVDCGQCTAILEGAA